MDTLLKLEEIGQFLLAILLFTQLDYVWWVFPACLLLPDISMLGYAINPRVGAVTYNIFHHKLTALLVLGLGFMFHIPVLSLAGIILFGHAAMDRIFGYGLKYSDDFKNTHLGRTGKVK
ncbi:DUF4260 domain-containing protein [Sphingobacterium gobiense]|uniref:DUF4260 domain-containing protein n=2 Tax=Sphingobacterium gobiense TaxID=1382456 RepID=A0A2S9JVU8_9SPHI|nr:DUF4260 domain-containing protein [Sphingobacterium gobiense]